MNHEPTPSANTAAYDAAADRAEGAPERGPAASELAAESAPSGRPSADGDMGDARDRSFNRLYLVAGFGALLAFVTRRLLRRARHSQ